MKTLTVRVDDTLAAQLEALARLDNLDVPDLMVAAARFLVESSRRDPKVAEKGAAIVAELDALFGENWSDLAASNLRRPSNGRPPSNHPSNGAKLQPVTGYL